MNEGKTKTVVQQEEDNYLKYLGTFLNINNVVLLLRDTLKNNSVCSRTNSGIRCVVYRYKFDSM